MEKLGRIGSISLVDHLSDPSMAITVKGRPTQPSLNAYNAHKFAEDLFRQSDAATTPEEQARLLRLGENAYADFAKAIGATSPQEINAAYAVLGGMAQEPEQPGTMTGGGR